MWLYFDRGGTLREIINDRPPRQGSYNGDYIYVYIERMTNVVDVSYLLPSGRIIGPTEYDDDYLVAEEIPFDPKRDLRYFKYGHEYDFLKIPLDEDIDGHYALEETGVVHCSIQARYGANPIEYLTLGDVNFMVEENAVLNRPAVAPEQYLSLANYMFLKSMAANPYVFSGSSATATGIDPLSDPTVTITATQTESGGVHYIDLAFAFGIPRPDYITEIALNLYNSSATEETWELDVYTYVADNPHTATFDIPLPNIQGGYWYVGTHATGVKAEGVDGQDGQDGQDGAPGRDGLNGIGYARIAPTHTTTTSLINAIVAAGYDPMEDVMGVFCKRTVQNYQSDVDADMVIPVTLTIAKTYDSHTQAFIAYVAASATVVDPATGNVTQWSQQTYGPLGAFVGRT